MPPASLAAEWNTKVTLPRELAGLAASLGLDGNALEDAPEVVALWADLNSEFTSWYIFQYWHANCK